MGKKKNGNTKDAPVEVEVLKRDYGKEFPVAGSDRYFDGLKQIADNMIPHSEPKICAPAPEVENGSDETTDEDQTT